MRLRLQGESGVVMDSKIGQQLIDLIPKTLDDIIRKNRDLVELGLATPAEIQTLEKPIPYDAKDVSENWRLVSLRLKTAPPECSLRLIGDSKANGGSPRITSNLISIDINRNVVLTSSGSIYRLGQQRGVGEPSSGHLMCVCAALHRWDSGNLLGAPEFFY